MPEDINRASMFLKMDSRIRGNDGILQANSEIATSAACGVLLAMTDFFPGFLGTLDPLNPRIFDPSTSALLLSTVFTRPLFF